MKLLHASLRYTREPLAVAAMVDKWRRDGYDVLTFTEATSFGDALQAPGYSTHHPKGAAGELAAMVKGLSSVRRVLQISERGIPRRGGRLPFALEVPVDGTPVVVTHMPSGVQGRRGLRRGPQTEVWRDCLHALAKHAAKTEGPMVIVADWNVDARKAWVRRLLEDTFPGFRVVAPKAGTHGRRVIDFALVRGFTGTAVAVPNPASDHKAVVFDLQPKEATVASATPMTDALIAALRRRGVEVLTHHQWGSVRRNVYRARLTTRPHHLIPGKPVDTLVAHITVTFDSGRLVGDFRADCRTVERIGFERFGSGASYNAMIDADAPRPRLAIGQFLEAKGTHTVNDKKAAGFSRDQNAVGLAFAFVGMPGDKLNAHARTAIVQLIGALIEIGALTPGHDLVPHSLFAAKDCPTDELRDLLPELRRLGIAAAATPAARPQGKTPAADGVYETATKAAAKAKSDERRRWWRVIRRASRHLSSRY